MGAEKIETPQSLSMLLRFAYQRNDLRSPAPSRKPDSAQYLCHPSPHLQASLTKASSTLPDTAT